jgi:hypothetical protein
VVGERTGERREERGDLIRESRSCLEQESMVCVRHMVSAMMVRIIHFINTGVGVGLRAFTGVDVTTTLRRH